MTRSHRDSRYQNTVNAGQQGFRLGQALRVGGAEIDDQAHNGLLDEFAAANAESSNFDQAGQLVHRSDHHLSVARIEKDAVIADQDRTWDLTRAAGKNEVEGEARFAGA